MSEEIYDPSDNTWALVVVQWRDTSSAPDTWVDVESYKGKETLALSSGWVWPKCLEGHLTLCGTVMPDPENPELTSDVTHIPMENVVSIYSLVIHLPVNWHHEDIA
jgi:hypothetical protein